MKQVIAAPGRVPCCICGKGLYPPKGSSRAADGIDLAHRSPADKQAGRPGWKLSHAWCNRREAALQAAVARKSAAIRRAAEAQQAETQARREQPGWVWLANGPGERTPPRARHPWLRAWPVLVPMLEHFASERRGDRSTERRTAPQNWRDVSYGIGCSAVLAPFMGPFFLPFLCLSWLADLGGCAAGVAGALRLASIPPSRLDGADGKSVAHVDSVYCAIRFGPSL
jgi:hypothetical protein